MHRTLTLLSVTLCALWLGLSAAFAQDNQVFVDRPFHDFEVGETINFKFRSLNGQQGDLRFVVKYDIPSIQRGFLSDITEETVSYFGGTVEFPFTLDEPGFLICEATINGITSQVGVSVSKNDIKPFTTEPSDFDAFWDGQKSDLRNVPVDLQIFPAPADKQGNFSTTYEFSAASIDGRRVHGYLVRPDGDGPFPASIRFPPHGTAGGVITNDPLGEDANCLAMQITVHDRAPEQDAPDDVYEQGDVSSREDNYYRNIIMDCVRAIDVLEESELGWNGEDLFVWGESQGGGLAMITAGLDNRVTHLFQNNASMGQHGGYLRNRPSGWPFFLGDAVQKLSAGEATLEQIEDATRYYDAMFFARRFDGISAHFTGFLDQVVPPETAYAAINQFRGPKIIQHWLTGNHDNPDEFNNDRDAFARQYFEESRNPPREFFSETSRSRYISAGDFYTVPQDDLLLLTPEFGINGGPGGDDWTAEWVVVDGPGEVTFENRRNANTNVSFDQGGTYTLELRVIDPYPEEENKYWELVDQVSVDVTGALSSTQDDLPGLTSFAILPNPADANAQVRFTLERPEAWTMTLRSATGQVVRTANSQGTVSPEANVTWDVADLPSGAYAVSVQTASGLATRSLLVR